MGIKVKPKNIFRAYCYKTKKLVYDNDLYNISNNQYTRYECRITNLGILWTKPYNKDIKTECECGFYSDWDIDMINTECDIMQSTGIKDFNGNLIFEGDIVSHSKESNLTDQTTYIGEDVVTWDNELGRFRLGDDDFFGMVYKSYKIIGNIYDEKLLTI